MTVFCSSSSCIDGAYTRAATDLGAALAYSGRTLVYGGGRLGLMGELSKSWRRAGGRVEGVITELLREAEQMDTENDENTVVATMRERKALMEERGDAFVILPGGLGTLEEFTEILVGRLLGEHDKPIIIVNTLEPGTDEDDDERGFYDPLLTLFTHMIERRFAKPGMTDLFDVVPDARGVLEAIERHEREPVAIGDRTSLMPGLPGGHGDSGHGNGGHESGDR
ncbi:MAG: TIGR00730 family Rossman fold protein [Planctomycetota bacterium]